MAQQFDNTNRGAAYRNKKKTRDTQPGYTGKINVEGEEYWISVWVKEAGPNSKIKGEKFLSLAVTPIEEDNRATRSENSYPDDFDDDIPF